MRKRAVERGRTASVLLTDFVTNLKEYHAELNSVRRHLHILFAQSNIFHLYIQNKFDVELLDRKANVPILYEEEADEIATELSSFYSSHNRLVYEQTYELEKTKTSSGRIRRKPQRYYPLEDEGKKGTLTKSTAVLKKSLVPEVVVKTEVEVEYPENFNDTENQADMSNYSCGESNSFPEEMEVEQQEEAAQDFDGDNDNGDEDGNDDNYDESQSESEEEEVSSGDEFVPKTQSTGRIKSGAMEGRRVQCDICDLELLHSSLRRHKKRHHKLFLDPQAAVSTKLAKRKQQQQPYKSQRVNCDICDLEFGQTSLRKHKLRAHPEFLLKSSANSYDENGQRILKQERVTCGVCGLQLSRPALLTHLKRIHPEAIVDKKGPSAKKQPEKKKKLVNCDICGMSISEPQLKKHRKHAHEMMINPDGTSLLADSATETNDEPRTKRMKRKPDRYKSGEAGISNEDSNENVENEKHDEESEEGSSGAEDDNYDDEDDDDWEESSSGEESEGSKGATNAEDEADGEKPKRRKRGSKSENTHVCEQCGKKMGQKYLSQHMKRVHGEDSVTCPECGKLCSSQSKLEVHIRVRHEKPFTCTECDKAFRARYQLAAHMRKHTGEKAYKCKLCPASYCWSNGLKSHMEIFHSDFDHRPYLCSICGSTFAGSDVLRKHMRIHTVPRTIACPHCPKKFRDGTSYTRHVRVHTGEKPFECDRCEQKFTQYNSMQAHQARFHGVPYIRKKTRTNPRLPSNADTVSPNRPTRRFKSNDLDKNISGQPTASSSVAETEAKTMDLPPKGENHASTSTWPSSAT